ncbi:MAG: hypothetical protein GY796_29255 [Chloroflexi bacterium]|nr:hypothetical protein [Chloroflexota bacterium]
MRGTAVLTIILPPNFAAKAAHTTGKYFLYPHWKLVHVPAVPEWADYITPSLNDGCILQYAK